MRDARKKNGKKEDKLETKCKHRNTAIRIYSGIVDNYFEFSSVSFLFKME